jgi:hypothetical protein
VADMGGWPMNAIEATGGVEYTPLRADPSSGWGPYEVHPQLTQRVKGGVASLEYEGEWAVIPPPGGTVQLGGCHLKTLVCTVEGGGRDTAEKAAVLLNGPNTRTRVVDLAGRETASSNTFESVHAQLMTETAAS